MKYWLAMVTPENAERIRKHECIGFRLSARRIAEPVGPGDAFFLYVTRVKEFWGPLRVEGSLRADERPLFHRGRSGDPYPLRVPLSIGASGAVGFSQIRDSLSWARIDPNFGLQYLTAWLTPGLMELSAEDGKALERASQSPLVGASR